MAWMKRRSSVQANDELGFCQAWLKPERELESKDRNFNQIGKDMNRGCFLRWLCDLATGKLATR
jgi:hypothetical protein